MYIYLSIYLSIYISIQVSIYLSRIINVPEKVANADAAATWNRIFKPQGILQILAINTLLVSIKSIYISIYLYVYLSIYLPVTEYLNPRASSRS